MDEEADYKYLFETRAIGPADGIIFDDQVLRARALGFLSTPCCLACPRVYCQLEHKGAELASVRPERLEPAG